MEYSFRNSVTELANDKVFCVDGLLTSVPSAVGRETKEGKLKSEFALRVVNLSV